MIYDDGGPLEAPPATPAMLRTRRTTLGGKVGEVIYFESANKTRVEIIGLPYAMFMDGAGDLRWRYKTGREIDIEIQAEGDTK